jgi:PAS domain S-box-containing protein
MAVNSGKDLASILEIATQHLTRNLNADGTTIALFDSDTLSIVHSTRLAPLRPMAAENSITPQLADLPYCLMAANEARAIFIEAEQVTGHERDWFQQIGLVNTIIVPLIAPRRQIQPSVAGQPVITNNTIVGFVFTTYQRAAHAPTSGQLAFAQDIATQCALAIDKAKILTQARKAAQLATERAHTLDAVFNAMSEGIIVLDLEGNIVLSNSTAAHFIGIPQQADMHLQTYLQGTPIYTLHGQLMPLEDFPLSRALRGEHVRGERFMVKRADASERLVEVNVAPLFDSEGNNIGIVNAFRDISEQIRVERRIRQALETMLHAARVVSNISGLSEMLHRVLTMALDVVNSERGVVQLYNQEQHGFVPLLAVGFTQDEEEQWLSEQKRWIEPEAKQYTGFRTQLLAGHATLISAEQCPDQSDILHHTMILAVPIKYGDHLLGLLMLDRSSMRRRERVQEQDPYRTLLLPRGEFSIWDMAVVEGIAQFAGLAIEQVRWQQEAEIARTNEATMRETNDLKDEFLGITAHEFRTPLTIIQAYSQRMMRALNKKDADIRPDVREKLQESIKNIEVQAHQLTNIADTFLEVARLNRGQISLTLEEVDLREVLQTAIAMYSSTSTKHTISATIDQADIVYHHTGDKARLTQIFANLLQNAIKYSPLGGPITVSLRCVHEGERAFAEICVADKGIGIPEEAQPHLFERFYRAPNIEGSHAGGVGLGLYVVAELLRLHGGTIHVESTGVIGEGSRFIFTLPLVDK